MDWLNATLIALAITLVALALFWLVAALLSYLRFRGQRLIVCPETRQPAAVEVAAGAAALHAAVKPIELHLKSCSRWPERQDCGQECLRQIENAPADCLVWNIVNRWYEDKVCAYCHQPFGHISWNEHRPALMAPDRRTVQWTDVSPETLPSVLLTHQPVCWNCHIAESFRSDHPELITDRR